MSVNSESNESSRPAPQRAADVQAPSAAEPQGARGARRFALRALLGGVVAAAGATLLGTSRPQRADASSTPGGIWYSGGEPNAVTGSTATIEGDNTAQNGIGVYGAAERL